MIIYLCRHGQTTGDVEDRYGGDYDDHLTDLGKTEAVALAKRLAAKKIEKIFSSPKIRAVETAEILSQTLGCDFETVTDLRERNQYGILTGLVKAQAKAKYPDLAEKLKDYRNTIEGAEDYAPFSQRVHQALFAITKSDYKTVAVITHGGPIKTVLRQIKYAFDYTIDDCAIMELEVVGDKIKILNQTGIKPKE